MGEGSKQEYSRSVVKPSQRDMNSVFILVIASWSVVRRCPKKLSTSSMKIIAGWSLWARLNTAATATAITY
jgi:hypothetical protein